MKMLSVNLNKAEFVKSAAHRSQFVYSSSLKIVFAGKSNVGKSSVINRVLNRKNFARVASEPGKTIHINYFYIDNKLYLIDLPGYSYAKVSRSEKQRWASLMETFFSTEDTFDKGIFIVDSRHEPTADDLLMAQWFHASGCPFLVVANKIDKLKKSEIEPNLKIIRKSLSLGEDDFLLPFSASKGTGRDELLKFILE